LLALVPISKAFESQNLKSFEYYSLFLFSILATILFIDSNDFLSIYLLIEMQSLCFYLLATFKKDSTFSSDSGIKYFIYSSMISALLLIALSSLYGIFGTLNFSDLSIIFFIFPFSEEFSGINSLTLLSLFCIILVLLFKLGITPFHFWVVDVYEGAPLASTIIFSYLPKLGLFHIILKLKCIFGDAFQEFSFLFLFTGLASVVVGALLALIQTRMKRFLIYSSISTTGFPIILLSYDINLTGSSIYFFLLLYIIGIIFSWTFFILLNQFIEKDSLLNTFKELSNAVYLTDLKSFRGNIDFWVFIFILALFALAGIPPLSGFVSKFVVIALDLYLKIRFAPNFPSIN
jgi:NADH-quinone oxidoreductase subunit N